jgi:predicted site-specific integrase-resolvase
MITTNTGENLFNYTEVCELLGCSDATIRKYTRVLGLHTYTHGGKIHFAEVQIRQIAEAMINPKPCGRKKLKK